MPDIDEKAFKKLIKSSAYGNIFFFYGNDDYLKEYHCGKLVALVINNGASAFNFHVFQDNETPLEDIFAISEILPVMAEKTCLLIKNYPLDTLNVSSLEDFEKRLSDIPKSTVMIFYYSSSALPDAKNQKWKVVIKIFSKLGNAVKIDRRTRDSLAKLLMNRAKEKDASIDYECANYLIECVGENMSNLFNEFNKVCAFSCGKPITKEMIDITAVKSIEVSVFNISSSIFSRDIDNAYKILDELLKQKTSAQSIIGALASAYVNLYRYKAALNAGKNVSDFADNFQYKETKYTFGKIATFAKKITLDSVRESINILAETDIKSKSIKIDEKILLTELIAKLAAAYKE